MKHLSQTLAAHRKPSSLDPEQLGRLIAELSDCAHTCHSCADACLAEEMVDKLRKCISSDLACAETTQTFANLLTHQTAPDKALLKAVAQACEVSCRNCAEECEKHASKHEHCDHCAKICRSCEKSCREVANML